jgi:NAD-dependent deacetylase
LQFFDFFFLPVNLNVRSGRKHRAMSNPAEHSGAIEIPEPLVAALRRARRVAVLTGSGISAESGVPTFRDAQTGLWSKFKPEEIATPEAFQRNPRLVWEDVLVERWTETDETPPRCPRCGGRLRPDVVWFGEALPPDAIAWAFAASQSCDLFCSIGTSTLVHPAASLPFEALQHGATVVEINPDPTPLTARAHHTLRGPAGAVLPALLRAAWSGESFS